VEAVSELEKELAAGERLLWSGRPLEGVRLRRIDAFLIPFSLVWLGLAVFWGMRAWQAPPEEGSGTKWVLAVLSFLCLWIGWYAGVGRLVLEAGQRGRTAYGITNRRVLAITRGRSRKVRSLEHDRIADVQLRKKVDRSGTLRILSSDAETFANAGRSGGQPQRHRISHGLTLVHLPRVEEVYEVLLKARNGASGQV
jgi:hypothetical protein